MLFITFQPSLIENDIGFCNLRVVITDTHSCLLLTDGSASENHKQVCIKCEAWGFI